MAEHAILSASSSHRWLNCTPSARLELGFGDKESNAAREGTAAHALCEHKLKKFLHRRSIRPVSEFDSDEMEECTDGYVSFVAEKLAEVLKSCKDPSVFIEQRLDLSSYVPESFGTADCIIASDGMLQIIDMKYGMGIVVDPVDNPQLKLYALGALDMLGCLYDINDVSLSIFQPRRDNAGTWTISVSELRAWAEEILKPRAEMAFKGEGEFCSGEWCVFCKASTRCRVRAEEAMKLCEEEFRLPPLLTDEEIEELLPVLPSFKKWAEDLESFALSEAVEHGKEWNGFKVVEGRSNRKYKDEELVAKAAVGAGYSDIYRKSLITITEMEKLMGKKKFAEVLGDLVFKPTGKPTLVPLSDKRPAMNVSNAMNDFSEDKE